MRNFTSAIPYTEFTVATGNFDTSRKPIKQIIIHSIVGTVQSAINVFGNPAKGTSIHYIVGNDGKLYAGLEEKWTAYHSGNYNVNQASIGIEHEWYNGMTINDALYKTSAKLVYDICKYYGLGINRGVIKAHKEIVPTGCPNQIDVDRIVREAQALDKPSCEDQIKELKKKIEEYKASEINKQKEFDKAKTDLENKLHELRSQLAEQRTTLLREFKDKLISKLQKIS